MIITLFFALAVAIIQLAISNIYGAGETIGFIATILHLTVAIIVYIFHGREMVTPLGIFAIASAAFLALPYVYGLYGIYYTIEPYHNLASVICLYSFCATSLIAISIAPPKVYNRAHIINIQFLYSLNHVSAKWLFVSILLLSLGWFSSFGSGLATVLGNTFIYVAFSLSLFVLISSLLTKKWTATIASALLSLFNIISFLHIAFTGFGRLLVASLGFVALILSSIFFRSYLLKILPIASAPLFLIWGGMIRSGSDNFSIRIILEAQGLGSLLAPFVTFSELLKNFPSIVSKGIASFQYGFTYLYNILFWIPRAAWESKPVGLGRMYVEWLAPQYLTSTQSFAGSYIGEAYINFHYAGILFVPILAGLIVGFISKYSIGLIRYHSNPDTAIVYILIFVILSSSMADFVWADTNLFTHRALVRLAVLICVMLIIYIMKLLFSRNNQLRRHRFRNFT